MSDRYIIIDGSGIYKVPDDISPERFLEECLVLTPNIKGALGSKLSGATFELDGAVFFLVEPRLDSLG